MPVNDDRKAVEDFRRLAESALALQPIPVRALAGSLLKMLCIVLLSLIDRIEQLERKAGHE